MLSRAPPHEWEEKCSQMDSQLTPPRLHFIDKALQAECPTVMVPAHGELEPMEAPGRRFLSASDGLWVEIKRPWLHLVWPVALHNGYPVPYGQLEKKIKLAFGVIDQDLIRLFIAEAKGSSPNEMGAWLVWDDMQRKLVYRRLDVTHAGPASLKFNCPQLAPHESLAVDLHSHCVLPAFFSQEDDRDDLQTIKIAGVFGRIQNAVPESKFRLCIGGKFIELKETSTN